MKKPQKNTEIKPIDTSVKIKLKKGLGIIIAVVSFCLYAQSISFNYANDDSLVIQENSLVKEGFSAIPILIKTDRLFGRNDESERMPEYRPVQMVVFAMEWQLFPNNPHAAHFFNVLLYTFTCWLLFLFLCKLFENQNLIFPFICTLFFTVHPIHTEVVDNIKGLDEILCFLFALLSLFLFIKIGKKQTLLKITLASIFFFLSLLSKETGIVYLIIIPLTLFVFSKVSTKRILSITIILAVITSIYLLIRFEVLESISHRTIENLHTTYINSLRGAPDFITQKATAFYILLKYFILLIFPRQLSFDYSFAEIPVHHIYSVGALAGILFYLFIGVYSILKIRKKDIVAFSVLFYLIALAPVSNIFLLINWTMAERFLYMPSLGFCIALSFLILKLTKTEKYKSKFNNLKQFFIGNRLIFFFVFIITGLYSIRTIGRNPDWRDNLTLFSHDVKVVPNCARAHYFYGNELLLTAYPMEKNKEKQSDIIDKAINEYTKSISLYYDQPIAYQYLAKAYYYKNDYANAIKNYEVATQHYLVPDAESFSNLGLLYSRTEKFEKGLNMMDSALKYNPNYTDAHINKTSVYLKQGKFEEAISEADKVMKYDHANEKALVVKGIANLNLKQFDLSLKYLNAALIIDSTDVTCLKVLGITYQNMGDTLNANKYFQKENVILNERQQ